jgi:hypothetical protein
VDGHELVHHYVHRRLFWLPVPNLLLGASPASVAGTLYNQMTLCFDIWNHIEAQLAVFEFPSTCRGLSRSY